GACTLVRVDALRELTLLVPVIGWLWLRHRLLAGRLAVGLAVGVGFGVVDGLVLSRPYVVEIAGSLVPLLGLFVLAVVGTVGALAILRGRPWAPSTRFATVAAWLTVLGGILFAIRPALHTAHGLSPGSAVGGFVAELQRNLGLPVDGTRTYAEASLHWLAWWIGWPAIGLAVCGAAILVRRVLTGRDPLWVPVLVVGLGSISLTLWRPGITPDHPWADRRFVPVVLPALVLFAVYSVAWLTRRPWFESRLSAVRGFGPAVVATAGAAAILIPTTAAAAPLLFTRTEVGSLRAIEQLCAALRPGDAVLLVDDRARTEWGPSIRGECGYPAVAVRNPDPQRVAERAAAVAAAGRTPVLMAAVSREMLQAVGGGEQLVVDVVLQVDQRLLVDRPDRTVPERFQVWMSRPAVVR
ncbi:MAG: hypothetical protein L0Y54_20325, partial [Sporichthyaceae bacterium]|nr:hypothetical protein [Sporichthyaceae bacterium]